MSFSIIAQIVYRVNSTINGEIIVKEQLGQHVLYTAGIPQSGGLVWKIWKKGVYALPHFPSVPQALLLGLGGGTVVHLLKKRWPKIKILAVEIDPQIVAISRTYFGLDKITGLKIANANAEIAVREKKYGVEERKFDLILVDLYLGQNVPAFAREPVFFTELKSLLRGKGVLVFNQLLDQKGRETQQKLQDNLKKNFPKIKTVQTASNELILACQT